MPSPSSSSSEPTTLVVVVNWNNAALTARCVEALDSQVGGTDFDLIVVDNGSEDDSVERLRPALGSRLLALGHNGGFGAGVNAAIRARRADRYILVNNDAVPAPRFVAELTAAADRASDHVAAFTARLELEGRFVPAPVDDAAPDDFVAADGSRWRRADEGAVLVNSTGGVLDASGNGQDRDWLSPAERSGGSRVFGFSGGGALLRAQALDRVGLFDESLFMYYEDTELSWRLAEHGFVVEHVPEAVLVHRHSASSGTSSWVFLFHNTRNRIKVAVWHASAPTVVRAVLRTLVRVVRSPRDTSAAAVRSGYFAALRDLPSDLRRRRRFTRQATHGRREIDTRTGLRRTP
ncbi:MULTISPECIES: glycosyltransferase family 2 protein [unclassified Frigoribacterium]|uniref:glycosyltransferase family 2 protein n=1 Tax=unclassified Frigoribacterium TaxID=2627005 RepID=UPI0006F833F2|nr:MULTISPECIES: glycosyltransferase family 2 protein [unclassified Frigoribacterium]KQO46601.1 hypothetical protein ASF07_02455 [Frigoribacterium sp. Leaf254]KQT38694.1 hypothetical protein ASG28_02455 [Frigoribacterium sp. Leaf415]